MPRALSKNPLRFLPSSGSSRFSACSAGPISHRPTKQANDTRTVAGPPGRPKVAPDGFRDHTGSSAAPETT
jgi:hypothetical protein